MSGLFLPGFTLGVPNSGELPVAFLFASICIVISTEA